ncbi:hypothetical protein VCHC50A1_2504, partial [Vibrio cholerae HC-50A1]
MANQRRQKLGH